MNFVCEWCVPSVVPEDNPEMCRIMFCQKHQTKTWHYPETAPAAAHPTMPEATPAEAAKDAKESACGSE